MLKLESNDNLIFLFGYFSHAKFLLLCCQLDKTSPRMVALAQLVRFQMEFYSPSFCLCDMMFAHPLDQMLKETRDASSSIAD